MTEIRAQSSGGETVMKTTIVGLLRSRAKKARFITELAASLRRSGMEVKELDRVLSELEGEGRVMIRDHFCADPHLAGVDLRIVAIVDGPEGTDPEQSAICEIDAAWNKWLAAYLANHQCS